MEGRDGHCLSHTPSLALLFVFILFFVFSDFPIRMVPRSSRLAVGSGIQLGGINRWSYRIDLRLGTFWRVTFGIDGGG
jgi:hypothetical protein